MTEIVERLLTEHLDTWIAAVETKSAAGRGSSKKLKLVGIAKLRELILELAVRGQLVPQDESDEPASVLLGRIAAERERLVEENKIRQPKVQKAVSENDWPFDIPSSWSFCRFGDVTINRDGERKPVSAAERKSIQGKYDYYGASGVIDKVDDFLFDKPLLLIGEDGANLVNRSTPIAFIAAGKYWVNNHAHVLDGISLDYLKYISLFINAISLEDYITGSAQPKMNQAKMNSIVVAIPPEAEQNRIVAKVDELMALCDALEQEQESSIAAHGLLVENLLAALMNAAGQGEFKQAWTRVAAHFDTLFTTEQSVEQLKQAILQLAVMGKLVEQDPADEPAGVLLGRIAAEKARLIEEKVIKKQKALPEISEEEKRFKLSEKWEWCFLTDVLAMVTDGDHQAPPKTSDGVPFLVIGNLNTGTIDFSGCRFVPQEYYDFLDWSRKPQKGDLLYTVTGSFGIPIEVNSDEPFCVQRHVAILKSTESSPCDYLSLLLRSKYAFEYASSVATGIAQKTVPLTGLRKLPVALPPLQEQHRIAKKVVELMRVCDQLKLNILESNISQLLLANALTEKTVL